MSRRMASSMTTATKPVALLPFSGDAAEKARHCNASAPTNGAGITLLAFGLDDAVKPIRISEDVSHNIYVEGLLFSRS